jgi:hypothetical protein
VEDLSSRTLRELLTLARQRLGSAASALKTREEVLAALTDTRQAPAPVPSPQPPAPTESVVTRDFFRRQG